MTAPVKRPDFQKVIVDDLDALLATLPPRVQEALRRQPDLHDLIEVILDLGRPAQARFPNRDVDLDSQEVTEADIQHVVSRIGQFGDDNRAGIERTLHRISCIRNRTGKIVGLTCRVGRAVFGTVRVIEDLVRTGKSVLLLGRPGVGKTTMLREVARVLAEDLRKRVIVVDTSNEIAGDGDIPHPAIGRARRMQVKTPSLQHAVMIEAVENHMPEVIIIDEMGTELEAAAARTIAERGVQLIATAHGNTLDNLILNPTLSDLVGGVQTVTLSDEEARRRGTQKTILERKAPPTFDIVVEIHSRDRVAVHPDVAATVDALLMGYSVTPEVRWVDAQGVVHRGRGEPMVLGSSPAGREFFPFPRGQRERRREGEAVASAPRLAASSGEVVPGYPPPAPTVARVYLYGLGRDRLLQVAHSMGLPLEVTDRVQDADVVLTTKAHYRRKGDALRRAEELNKPVYVLRKNTPAQIAQFARTILGPRLPEGNDRVAEGLREAEEAIERVLAGEPSVELEAQPAFVRRLQHQLAERYNLASASTGREPHRRVIIYRP
ncbi:MAG: AAA family ATPase [Dehalococcoidia bacterium]|nr:AAA family ATPase [Dehalococcoidia bacterium]MDW8119691.1 R3H domain-containing nucleic acid-binding protein [Chloroflexota bacterium]